MQDGWVLISQIDNAALLKQILRPIIKIFIIFVLTWLSLFFILRESLGQNYQSG